MLIAVRGDLRQMSYRQHLAALAEPLQQPADGIRDRAADPGIDLVEDQRRDWGCGRGDHRNRQADTRELAARGDASQRFALVPACPATRNSTLSIPQALGSHRLTVRQIGRRPCSDPALRA